MGEKPIADEAFARLMRENEHLPVIQAGLRKEHARRGGDANDYSSVMDKIFGADWRSG